MPATEKHTYTYLCEKRALRKRYQIIAALQATLSLAAFGLSLLPWCDEIAYSWFAPPLPWLTRTSSMWAAAVALCLLWGRFGDTLWLSTAYDLQLIVALVSATCFLLLGWNVVSIDAACSPEPAALHAIHSHPHLHSLAHSHAAARAHRAEHHAASRDGDVALSVGERAASAPPAFLHKMAMAIVGKQDAPIACEPFPTRIAVATFYGMGMAMSLQVGVCICAAFAVRSAKIKRRLELTTTLPTTQPPPPIQKVVKLPRGWREHVDPHSGRCFYEHVKSKKIQWEWPTGSGRREAASDAEDGRSGCYSDSNYRTS
uniref:WW domain-containing protein n=1 Tax=Calcidiscus leptoporus TaxID=127549 RepID=A0A7S0P4N7_9EUKA|mmetsp:Transcript_6142/g.14175  ORF Transcript_6142/g.14175 Transcript_6142/m.14175 type:complete len:315 (+) Transcript_6142:132-1076(+)